MNKQGFVYDHRVGLPLDLCLDCLLQWHYLSWSSQAVVILLVCQHASVFALLQCSNLVGDPLHSRKDISHTMSYFDSITSVYFNP